MPNTIIDTRNLSNQVYDYIIKSIIDRKLVFGQITNIRKTVKAQFFGNPSAIFQMVWLRSVAELIRYYFLLPLAF